MDVAQFSGYLLFLPAAVAFCFQWKQNQEVSNKLAHTEQLFKRRSQELERVQKEWEVSLGLDKTRQQKWVQLEKQVKDAKAKVQELLDQQELLKAAHEKALLGVSENIEDKNQQITILLQQLKEQDLQSQLSQKKAREIERAAAAQMEQAEEKIKASRKGQESELHALRVENRKLETQLQQSQKILATSALDAEQEKRLKKQLAQYRYFNQTVCSQRELLEERLENWETALKGLATAVCTEKGAAVPTSLGPLVGTALELLNQNQLVDDQEFTPHGTVSHESTLTT